MSSIGQASALRNRKWHGTVFAISQTARLVNFPLAQDIAHHVQKLVVALKTPKDNDMEAQELADRIGELLDFLDSAAGEIESAGVFDASEYLTQLLHLRSHLERSFSELQTIHKLRYTTRLASQSRIRDSIQDKKDQLLQTKFDVLMCLMMFTLNSSNHAIAQNSHSFDLLAESHKAACERLQCLERRFDAVLLTRRTDERGRGPVACFVFENGRLIFFFNHLQA